MVNYDLPLNVKKLYNCPAIQLVVEKIGRGVPVTVDELKLLVYAFTFFGEQGKKEIQEIIKPLDESVKKDVQKLIEILVSRGHLPISCTKIKDEYGICSNLDCDGSVTPIMHCCGEDPNVELVEEIHLSDLDAKLLKKYVKSEVYVSGVGDPFSIPYLMNIRCMLQTTEFCKECAYAAGKKVTISNLRNELNEPYLDLEFVKTSKSHEQQTLSKYIQQYLKKNIQCPLLQFGKYPRLDVTVEKEKVITPLIVAPAIDEVTIRDVKARESLRKRVYLSGVKRSISRKGLLVGPVLKHPRDGQLTMLAICFKPTDINLEAFKTKPEHKELFKLLQERSEEELINIIGTHVCGIYGRPDAVEANLIAYHAPLYLIWKNEQMPAWVQISNFGDTTVGKSQIPRTIKQLVGLGLYVVVETSGRTGLLYFIDQSREGHILGFGELPLADRTLVIIDGADRMHPEERAEFRESYRQGFLKMRRVVSGSAPMRVRLIACENVKKPLSEYLYPCTSLLENYKAPDIARLDLAIPYRREDVGVDIIYKPPGIPPGWFNKLQEALRLNIILAWSRRPEQIKFENDAEKEIFETAKAFDYKYGNSRVPLVSKDFDKKLAKLGAGYAAWRCSYDQDWNLIVKREHVEHVAALIARIYSSEGMRLDQYAMVMKERSTLTDKDFENIKRTIDLVIEEEIKETGKPGRPTLPIMSTIIRELQVRGTVSLSELQAAVTEDISVKVSVDTIRQRILLFKKHYLVVSTKEGYTLTPKGIEFMHRYTLSEETTSTPQTTPEEETTLPCWICRHPIDQLTQKWTVDSERPCHIDCLLKYRPKNGNS